jgi:hypothetical protein
MVTGVADLTAVVVIAKACEFQKPCETVTVAGTAATAGLELVKVMVSPPDGAGPSICTELEGTVAPPCTLVSESSTAKGVATLTIS